MEECPGKVKIRAMGDDVSLEHEWRITQSQGYTRETGYIHEVGIRCAYCPAEFLMPEADVIAYFVSKRSSSKG